MELGARAGAAEAAEAAEPPEARERVAAARTGARARGVGVEARGALVEGGGAVRVVGLLLLGVGQDLVGGLRVRELVFSGAFFVRVRVVFFGEVVVGFLDLRGRGVAADAEDGVRVFGGMFGCGGVEVLERTLARRKVSDV